MAVNQSALRTFSRAGLTYKPNKPWLRAPQRFEGPQLSGNIKSDCTKVLIDKMTMVNACVII